MSVAKAIRQAYGLGIIEVLDREGDGRPKVLRGRLRTFSESCTDLLWGNRSALSSIGTTA